MIKVITIITNFIVITLMALLFGSCNSIGKNNTITGSGHVTAEKRDLSGNFKTISVNNALDLVVEQSDKTEIIVEADDNLQKEIITKVENGVLVIYRAGGNFNNVTSKKITVKTPIIDGLEASSASTVNCSTTLKGNKLILVSSSAASILATVEYENIQLTGSSASTLNIKGKALQVEASTSSASAIDASELLANEVTPSTSSGGSIKVRPIENLKAEASSGGNIIYKGTPKSIQKKESSGGSIHQG